MSLKQKILQDMRAAQKGGDKLKLSVIRLILSDIKYKEIKLRKDAEDQEVLEVLSSAVKKRKESIEQFQKGGRDDLVEKERTELEHIQSYLPPKLSEEKLLQLIDQTVNEVEAEGPKDMGKVMRAIMPKIKGRADGKTVNNLVSSRLTSTQSQD
ncbi:MAG: hypothetical protein AMJ90_09055 [candidate division Zixibacteria bacterium SM23_73_2]|nr:MAG: hypothetical protein AMJ90_09055 [candidate division Zixibacteria bacterium SM23_73_2]